MIQKLQGVRVKQALPLTRLPNVLSVADREVHPALAGELSMPVFFT